MTLTTKIYCSRQYIYDSGAVKTFFFCLCYRVLGECSEEEDSFHYSIRGSTTKVDDLGVEFLSSDEENEFWLSFCP
jgi:hypothetical protein